MQSFAQMTPKQLLEESERALADGKYYRIHQELVQETKLLENSERVRVSSFQLPSSSVEESGVVFLPPEPWYLAPGTMAPAHRIHQVPSPQV